jgi:hypothetical protein
MRFGNRGPRASGTAERRKRTFQPGAEGLEEKMLLSIVQLGAGTTANLAGQTTTAPNGPQTIAGQLPFIADSIGTAQTQGNQTTDPGLGVMEAGSLQAQGVGYSVAAVGDMNGDGSNDFLVGAPSVTRSGTVISPSTGTNSQAFLIFGNRSVTVPTTQNWASATPEQRVGTINQLGNGTQANPFTNRGQPYNYNFDGITFITGQSPNSQLGAYVAAAGTNALLIGAPNYSGGGRLYLVTATSNFNSLTNRTVDLDAPAQFPGLTIVTFTETANTTSGLGVSAALVPNLFGDGNTVLAIGEPGANTVNGTNTGAVYAILANNIPQTAGANNLVTPSTAASVVTIAGEAAGDRAGFSVANAGNVNNATGGINDIVIGAPGAQSSQGRAYLLYGGAALTNSLQSGVVNLNRIDLNPNTIPVTGAVATPQGAVFQGTGTDQAGFLVNTAGDFNGDNFGDFMIAAPFAGGSAGRVNLFYGADTGTPTNTTNGNGLTFFSSGISAGNPSVNFQPIRLNAVTNAVNSWTFTGQTGGARAGFSMSLSAPISGNNVILIGAPGDTGGQNAGQGAVYQLARAPGTATINSFVLNSTNARQFTLAYPTNAQSSNAIGFGNSVSSFPTGTGDFIAGAPGYTGTLPTTTATPPIPLVGAVAIPLQSLQVAPIPLLTGGSSGGGGGGGGTTPGGGLGAAILPGLFQTTQSIPNFGSSFVPTVTAFSTLSYAPIPLNVALQQYDVPNGFKQRFYMYDHPNSGLVNNGQNRSRKDSGSSGRWTLGRRVFTRGRFHEGKSYVWTHNVNEGSHSTRRVVPVQLHTERYTSQAKTLSAKGQTYV